MWKLHFCVFLSIVYLCAGDDECSSTLATTACESPEDQPTPRQNQPPPNTTPPPPIEETPAPAPPPPPKQSPLAPPKDLPLSPKNPTGNSCPTEDEQNTICNKAKESQFKNNPFCQNTGEADEGCKQLTQAITGVNPKCYQPDVCSFTTKDGTPAYVCSKDMPGVTLYKGCDNDISIISKPDKSPLAPPKDQSLSPKNPTGNNCPTEDEQNTICNKAKESQFKNNPFCQNTGEADEGCKQLTQAITGVNPKCYQPDVCSFTTKDGTTAYVCSKDIPGVTLYKGCNNDISIISKPDKNSKPSPGPGPENGTKKSGSPPSNTPTDHEQNLICVKASEDEYKEPFCQNTGGADEACKKISDSINGSNPSCCNQYVCQFTSSAGTTVYVSSQDISGATVYKGCHHNVKIISKPDGGWPAPSPRSGPTDNDTKPSDSPPSNTPTDHEQNLICVKASEDEYKEPFCQNTGGADEACKKISDSINGSNPSCCNQYVCQFTSSAGTTVYVSSQDISGATVYKGCHHNVKIISKPDGGWPAPSPRSGPTDNDTKPSDSLPSNTPTDHEQNLICVKASEDEYKEPFCQNTGGADEACKKISDSINGSNPSCCNQYVCQFTSSAGTTVYVSSQDISGATVYKGCHHNVKIISKPDGGWPAPSPRSGPTDNDTKPSDSPPSNTPTDHEQNLICVKASEDEYKEPFCQNTGGADEACKKISDSINGSNPSCCNQYVCQFTSSAGATVYVSSQDIPGATVYKGCHHNVKIISKPDGGWPAPSPRSGPTENDTKSSGSPPSDASSDHEQNVICFKAAGEEFKTGAFCDVASGPDDKCKLLSDAINGSNPSCCTQYVCQITSAEGTLVYVASKDIQGVHEIKGCHNNVKIISKPDGDLGNKNNTSSSPPQSLNTPPSNNQPPATDPPKSTPHIGSPTKEPEESCSTTEPTTPPSTCKTSPTSTALPAC